MSKSRDLGARGEEFRGDRRQGLEVNAQQRYKRNEHGRIGIFFVLDQRPGYGKDLDVQEVEGELRMFSRQGRRSLCEGFASPA